MYQNRFKGFKGFKGFKANMYLLATVGLQVKRMMKPVYADDTDDRHSRIRLDQWMTHLPKHVRDKPICSLMIPGSHDAGGYGLTTRHGLAPDMNDIQNSWWFKYFPRIALRITKKWTRTQDVSISEQIRHGVRYFDLRGAPLVVGGGPRGPKKAFTSDISLGNEAFASNIDLYFVHGLYGPRIYDMLKSISKFLEDNPGEVVILHFQHFHSVTEEMLRHLMKQITSLFGSKICPSNEFCNESCKTSCKMSLNDLTAKGYQVIIFFPVELKSFKSPYIWPPELLPNPWADTTSVPLLETFLDCEQSERLTDRFFVSQCVLTPNNKYIRQHFYGSLKSTLAYRCNQFLLKWLDTRSPGVTGPNIVMCDFIDWQRYSIPRKVVRLNYETKLN